MTEKKVKITGQVQIDQGQATGELDKLNAELAEFRAGMADIKTGITLILRSLASMSKAMGLTTTETEDAAKAAKEQTEATADAAAAAEELGDETGNASEETEKLSGKTEILRGLWQRIGHRVFDGLLAGLRGLANYMVDFLSAADDFGTTIEKMSARGVKDIDKVRLAVVELAGDLGEDLVDVVKSVDLAESLGAGDGAIEAARAAWENFRVTGMDVNRQIEVSTRLARAFNAEVGEQAELIRQVGEAAQAARVDQSMLWNGMSSMGPRIQQLGGTFQDLMRITSAGLAAGVKAEEEGLKGLNELLNSLVAPTDDFGQKLAELGVIVTETSPRWKQLTAEVNAQKSEFEALNAELDTYKRETAEIGLLTSQAERAVSQFGELNEKRESGQRLNRLERQAFRDLRGTLSELNDELSAYDKAGRIVSNGEFRRMTTVEQLKQRIDSAKNAQEELNLASQEAQLDAQALGMSLQTLDAQMASVATSLRTEIPTAIREAISQGGLPEFISRLSAVPEALKPLSAEIQVLVSTLGNSMGSMGSSVGVVGGAVESLGNQLQSLHQKGVDGLTRLKQTLGTLATLIVTPVMDAMNMVSQVIIEKLQEPFSDGSTVFTRISEWATFVAAAIITDIEAVTSGDQALGDVLTRWVRAALERVSLVWEEYAAPMIDGLKAEMEAQLPALRSFMEVMFRELGMAALNAFGGAVGGLLDRVVGGGFDSLMNMAGANQGTAQLGVLSSAYGGNMAPVNNTYNVNGAQDPMAVADEISRRQSQQERLGLSTARRNGPSF